MKPKGKKLMVVYAHPDDAEIWSGGAIAKWVDLGGAAKICCFASCDKNRKEEAVAGAKILKAKIEVLPAVPIYGVHNVDLIRDEISAYNPNILITHFYRDTHPEHRNVFEIVNNALIGNWIEKGNPEIFLCSNTYNSIGLDGGFEPDVYIDISDYMKVKLGAIRQHKSQPYKMWERCANDQAKTLAARLSGAKYAEGFVQVPILGKLANLSLF